MTVLKRLWASVAGKLIILLLGLLILFILVVLLVAPSGERSSKIAQDMQRQALTNTRAAVNLNEAVTVKTVAGRLYQQKQTEKRDMIALKNEIKAANKKSLEASAKQNALLLHEINALKKSLAMAKTKAAVQTQTPKTKTQKSGFVVNGALNPTPGSGASGAVAPTVSANYRVINDASLSLKTPANAQTINNDDVLHGANAPKNTVKPMYTIPANTLLTGVIPEQPLVGVIPTDSNTVRDPETVQFMLGRKNFSANGWRLPDNIKGIQGNATCFGVFNFNHSAVRCAITSLTFIFPDGTIATKTATTQKPFGVLTDAYGNPYIAGFYHGNALLAGAGTGVFAGIQGWGNAIAASQQQTTSTNLQLFQTIKNANKYGLGSALGSAGEAWNNWWLSVVRSTTNYVFVPNWNKHNHHLLQLNAKILQPVAIDYDNDARKVEYTYDDDTLNTSLD